ncbi:MULTISPECIES: LysR family transcriptional regulator [unclassified Olleya]|jgi:DNA-binding transcriptional LysR family regulator|uniref:LysR family transcriptional regulator n=1 Tax=unclassified Olleya TaxID=2615019 RepID=UPI00119EEB2E|nr:LysR substrate-binding domain-containing protein [Olleya sp. Hel_I_94]TVZ46736.1 DNA-binding transcriptional LysR family regulator [Olleya sp. Hel_I_94]
MTTQQIKYFLVLAEELHFWNTAEKVFISQSSLTRQIQALEDELGFSLFERNKRNVKLTDAGKFLQQHWGKTINELDHIYQQAKKINQGDAGVVSISYPGSITFSLLPNFLGLIKTNLPDLKLELAELTDENHEKLLLNYKTDIAFSRDSISHINIQSLKLFTEPICIAVPFDHWLNTDTVNNIDKLQHENFILSGLHQTTYFSSLLRNLFNQYGFEPKISIESDFGGMILNLVSKGLGISILPHSFKYSKFNNVRFIDLDQQIDLYIHWRKNEVNKTITKVIDCAKQLDTSVY